MTSKEKYSIGKNFFLENNLLGFLIFQENKFKFVNQKCADISGYTLEELENWSKEDFYKIIYEADKDFAIKQLELKLQGKTIGVVERYTLRIIHKNGAIIPLEIYSNTQENDGSLCNFITVREFDQNYIFENERKMKDEMIKLEIEIPKDRFMELKVFCKKKEISIMEKVREIIINSLDSVELNNF